MSWLFNLITALFLSAPPGREKHALKHHDALPCELVIGNRGTGKSEGLKGRWRKRARERKTCQVLFDLHGTTARDLLGWGAVDGCLSRTFIDVPSMTDKALAWRFLRVPQGEGLTWQSELERNAEEFLQAIWNKRGQKDGQQNPWIKQYSEAAVRVFLTLPEIPPLQYLLKIFEPESREHAWMMDSAKDRDSVRVFSAIEQSLPMNGGKHPNQYWMETRPAWRAMRIVESPSVYLHHDDVDFWREAIEKKYLIVFDLSGISAEAARFLTISGYTGAVNACRELFQETLKPHGLHICLEEAGATGTVAPFVVDSLQQDRKRGVSWEILSQTSRDFEDQELFEQLVSLCDVHRWYRVNSGADRAARDLCDPAFDALAVHYTRTRMVQAGTKTTRSHRKDHHGKELGVTESQSPVYREQEDEYYKSPQVQLQEWETKVSNLQVGQCYVRTKTGVEFVTDTLVGTAWPSFIQKKRTERLISEVRARPHYKTPKTWTVPRGGAAARFGGGS